MSSTRVLINCISKAITQAVALNAPNGTFRQKFQGAVFGVQATTDMRPEEAKMVLNFEDSVTPSYRQVVDQLNLMNDLNDATHEGGSPYLGDRFLAAAHVLVRLERN